MAAYCRRDFGRYGRKLADNWFFNKLLIGYVKNNESVAKYTKCNCIAIISCDVLKKRKKRNSIF